MIIGEVVSVNISTEKGTLKKTIKEGKLITEYGLEGDAHGGKWHRQISLLAEESIAKMEEKLGYKLQYGSFAENITTKGITLHTLPVGTRLRIGQTLHEVTQIGKTCHSDCEIAKKVGKCIMPLEGIFTRVIYGGIIKAGDKITVEEVM